MLASLRRLQEEDPTIDLHRDPQTGEQIVAGLSQVHVEVIVDRLRDALRRRGHAEASARALPGDDPCAPPRRTAGTRSSPAGAASSATATSSRAARRPASGAGFEFVNQIKGGVIPSSFIPAVEKGVREAMEQRRARRLSRPGRPRDDSFDGAFHSVDSSELAFKLAGAQAMRQALEQADPVLLEPMMMVTLSVPEAHVGDVIGDLNGRRGPPQGMEPVGAHDRDQGRGADVRDAGLRARPPLDHPGQGDYTLEFLRYEEVPGHLAQRVVAEAGSEQQATHA